MPSIFRQYFIFSDKERRAVVALSIIVLVLFLLPYFWKKVHKDNVTFDANLQAEITAFNAQYNLEKSANTPVFSASLFYFDPNTIGVEEWQKLGLSEKQARVIENYKAKGGHFRKAEDIRKVFVLSEEQKEKLLPFVKIEKSPQKTVFSDHRETISKYEKPKVDINTADSAMFEKLPFIGAKRAANIVKYRTWLGGFYAIEQVAEVYSLPDSVYQKIKPQLTISKIELKKININTADFNVFRGHPYTRRVAGHILKYREANAGFKTTEQICRVPEMTDSICQKLLPYIVVE